MSFEDAIALQPTWVAWWLNWLFIGAFVLPFALLIWRQSRVVGLVTLLSSFLAAAAVYGLFGQLGYVKLLGLPHVLIWTPLVAYLYRKQGKDYMPVWPRRIIWVVMVTITISLAFDYVDVIRYALGARDATALPA
jgi:hypothetical protein|tara:strand:- start:83436 stop:83840 length:405 start_codon:yes stop_codon:yes gene_type:complete